MIDAKTHSETDAIKTLAGELTFYAPQTAAVSIESEGIEETADFLKELSVSTLATVLDYLSPVSRKEALQLQSEERLIQLLNIADPRTVAPIISMEPVDRQRHLLSQLDRLSRQSIEMILSYRPDTAGALMNPKFITLKPDMTVGLALKILRKSERTDRSSLYVVDRNSKLVGVCTIEDLALADEEQHVADLAQQPLAIVDVNDSREDIIDILESYKLSSLPVLLDTGVLVGVIHHNTLVDAAIKEISLDMQTMVGVSKDESVLSSTWFSVRKRLPWLQINLLTAFMAAAVVGLFESTIAQNTALAILLPVVAGQSGNTGAQSLAVTMRGLSLREIHLGLWPKVVFKETSVALFNGIAVALTTAIGVLLWSKSVGLALIIGISMVLSMIMAGMAGAAVPMVLRAVGQDPAQSSSIILTTITDVTGFFSFLGIATLLSSLL